MTSVGTYATSPHLTAAQRQCNDKRSYTVILLILVRIPCAVSPQPNPNSWPCLLHDAGPRFQVCWVPGYICLATAHLCLSAFRCPTKLYNIGATLYHDLESQWWPEDQRSAISYVSYLLTIVKFRKILRDFLTAMLTYKPTHAHATESALHPTRLIRLKGKLPSTWAASVPYYSAWPLEKGFSLQALAGRVPR